MRNCHFTYTFEDAFIWLWIPRFFFLHILPSVTSRLTIAPWDIFAALNETCTLFGSFMFAGFFRGGVSSRCA